MKYFLKKNQINKDFAARGLPTKTECNLKLRSCKMSFSTNSIAAEREKANKVIYKLKQQINN